MSPFVNCFTPLAESSHTYGFLRRASPPFSSSRHGRQLNDGDDGGDVFRHIHRTTHAAGVDHLYYKVPELPRPSSLRSAPPSPPRRSEKPHVSFLAGVRVLEADRNPRRHSGYQVMRLATELVPTYAAILGEEELSLRDDLDVVRT